MRYSLTVLTVLSVVAGSANAQQKTMTPDLRGIADGKGAKIPGDVSLEWVEDVKGKPALKVQPTKKEFSEKDEWVVVLTGIEFPNGVVEFDALGQSGPPQSNFLGVAFRVLDEKTHDAVYFRPFNFRADDAERKAHAVQYISHPRFRWFDLRKECRGDTRSPSSPRRMGMPGSMPGSWSKGPRCWST